MIIIETWNKKSAQEFVMKTHRQRGVKGLKYVGAVSYLEKQHGVDVEEMLKHKPRPAVKKAAKKKEFKSTIPFERSIKFPEL